MNPPPLDLDLARKLVAYLNKAAETDRDTLLHMMENRTRCSEDFPAVAFQDEGGEWGVGLLGMFNWMCGQGPSGRFPIMAHIDFRTAEDAPAPPWLRPMGLDKRILRGFSLVSDEMLGLPVVHPEVGWPIYRIRPHHSLASKSEAPFFAMLVWEEGGPAPEGLVSYILKRHPELDESGILPKSAYTVALDARGDVIKAPVARWPLIAGAGFCDALEPVTAWPPAPAEG